MPHLPRNTERRYRKRLITDQEILDLYEKGVSCKELALRAGISNRQMTSDLTNMGIELRPYRGWLDVIDSDAKAYALGLIWSDGSLSKKTVAIVLQDTDAHVLRALKESSGFGHVAPFRKAGLKTVAGKENVFCHAMTYLRWHSQDMLRALRGYGLCENKMKVLPEAVLPPREYMRGFVRGLIDGDGHLSLRKNGDILIAFSNHNESLLRAVADYFANISGKRHNISRSHKGNHLIKNVMASGPAAAVIATELYLMRAPTIAIERKRQKARLFGQWLIARSAIAA